MQVHKQTLILIVNRIVQWTKNIEAYNAYTTIYYYYTYILLFSIHAHIFNYIY